MVALGTTANTTQDALDMFTTIQSTGQSFGTNTGTDGMTTMRRDGETTSSTFLYTTLEPAQPHETHSGSWTVEQLYVLGAVLWVVMIITLLGNLACFYAVIKNMKVGG